MTGNTHLKTTARYLEPVDHAGQLVAVLLSYSSDDPLAITAHIGDATWTFGRDLLADGLTRVTPQALGGDVRTWVGPEGYVISLDSPFGAAKFALPTHDVNQFLYTTFQLVAKGEEYTEKDVDAELAAFFGQKEN